MDLSTQTHLHTLRNLLMYRLHELQHDVHLAHLARRDQGAVAAGVADAQEQRDLSELADAAAALMRLNDGTYGDCVDCGAPIALQRLLAQPSAPRCVSCQAASERKRAVVSQA